MQSSAMIGTCLSVQTVEKETLQRQDTGVHDDLVLVRLSAVQHREHGS
jgi:hypothetical protein